VVVSAQPSVDAKARQLSVLQLLTVRFDKNAWRFLLGPLFCPRLLSALRRLLRFVQNIVRPDLAGETAGEEKMLVVRALNSVAQSFFVAIAIHEYRLPPRNLLLFRDNLNPAVAPFPRLDTKA
jgi:signal transduction histidine kinase